MPKQKTSTIKLQVFKGREAKLNKAIFQTLVLRGSQIVYEIHKQIRKSRGLKDARYANVNLRVRKLESSGYLEKTGSRKTKAGFEASLYGLTSKTYVALLLESVSFEELLDVPDEAAANQLMAAIVGAMDQKS